MIYTHVLKLGGGACAARSTLLLASRGAVRMPLDALRRCRLADGMRPDPPPHPRAAPRAPPAPAYAELHCRSNFSFLTGASHPEELVARAHALGYSALALTDECSLAGVVRAHAEAKRAAAAPDRRRRDAAHAPGRQGQAGAPHAPRLVLLAQTRRGYGNLSQWITVARRRAAKGQLPGAPVATSKGSVPHAPTWPACPTASRCCCPARCSRFETVFAHAMWLKTWFGAERAVDRGGAAAPRRTTTQLRRRRRSAWRSSPACRSSPPAAC